jgi:hypothetical protein
LIGFVLRVYLLRDQVLLDDEWHGLYYVIGRSPGWLLTHFSVPGATCIPQNLYEWALFSIWGWSEVPLRLPSLVSGLLIVPVGALLARRLVGERNAGLLACLLACSPILVFYSRLCRPYSSVALLTFAAVLLAASWQRSGRVRSAVWFGIAGVFAVYFHLYAAVSVAAPIMAALLFHSRLIPIGSRRAFSGAVPVRGWLLAGGITAAIACALLGPALVHAMRATLLQVAFSGQFDWRALPRAASLISGTGQPAVAILFWLAVVQGALQQWRRDAWFGATLVSLYPLHALALLVTKPDFMHSAIVLTRYCIALVPVSLLLAACGVHTVLDMLQARTGVKPLVRHSITIAFVALLLATGPIPQFYKRPNAFTNHGAYQNHYGPIDWARSFHTDLAPPGFDRRITIRADEVSPFYGRLAAERGNGAIVEYPMMIGDQFNTLYYYQHFHERAVLVGYTLDTTLSNGLGDGNIFGNTYVDQVLSLVRDRSRLHFRNLVSMEDLDSMRARGVEYVILHARFEAELPSVSIPLPAVNRLWYKYREVLGEPVYMEDNLVVFRL